MNIVLLSLALSGFTFTAPMANVATTQEVTTCEPCTACPAATTVAACEPCESCE